MTFRSPLCEANHAARYDVSTKVWFDIASTPTNTFASRISPVRPSVTSTAEPA